MQAGLHALLPVQEREGIALPGTPSASDPDELIATQENYEAVFESGVDTTPAQRATAIKPLELAAQQLKQGRILAFCEESDRLADTAVNGLLRGCAVLRDARAVAASV